MIKIQYICDICKKEIVESEIANITLTRPSGETEAFQIHDECVSKFRGLLSGEQNSPIPARTEVHTPVENFPTKSAEVSEEKSFKEDFKRFVRFSASLEEKAKQVAVEKREPAENEPENLNESKSTQQNGVPIPTKIRALTAEQVEEMVAMYNAGKDKDEIAEHFNIKATTVVQKMSQLRKSGRKDIVRRGVGGPAMKFNGEEPTVKNAENNDEKEQAAEVSTPVQTDSQPNTADVQTGDKEFQSGSFSSQNGWQVIPFEEDDLAKEISMTKEDMQRIMIAYYFGGIGLVKSRLNISSRIIDIVKQLAAKYYQEPLNALYNSSTTKDSRVQFGDKSVEWRVVCNLFVTKWKNRDIAWELKIDESLIPGIIELYSGVK